MMTPGQTFSGRLFWVSLAHAVLIGVFLGFSIIPGCEGPPDTRGSVVFIVPDFQGDDASPDSPPQAEVTQTEAPPSDQDTVPDTVKEKKAPTPKSDERKNDVEKAAPKKNPVKVSTTLVKRPAKTGGKTSLTAEQLQRLRDLGGVVGKPTLSDDQLRILLDGTTKYEGGVPITQEMLYRELMRQVLYWAWDQPREIGIAGLVTHVELSMDPDGSITCSRITAGSGNPVMDESVMSAVKSVRRIPRLPAEYLRSHSRIVVAFELTGNG